MSAQGLLRRLVASALAGGACCAADVVLVADGQPRAHVVVPDGAPAAVRGAAEDLVRVLRRMSGAGLPLVNESQSDPATARVLIGDCEPPAGIPADTAAVLRDDAAYAGYVLACGANAVVLRGATPKGTANAVYGFLQDQLGVRWLMPSELFEIVPQVRTIAVPEMRQAVTPSFVCRLASASWGADTLAWGRRNRWDTDEGGFAVPYAAGFRHWMYRVFPPSKWAATQPEIYPLLNGKRAIPEDDGDQLSQPCTGNPETVRIAIETINAYLDAHPEVHTYPFSINDNNTWCECERCRAHDVERPAYRGRRIVSDRWFTFVNAVARGVGAKHPGKYIGCFAYAGVELPPLQIEAMEPNVFINLTQDTAQYFDPEYRAVDYDLIRAWQQKCSRVGKYDYYGLGALAPRYFPHLLAADLKAVHGLGVRAFHSELYPYWANMGPMLYVASRLLWDVSLDPDRLLDEFFTSAFGPAAAEVQAFYAVLEAAWMSQTQGKWFAGIGSAAEQMDCYTTTQVAECAAHLRAAEALASDETVRARIRYLARGYAYADLLLGAWTTAREVAGAPARSVLEADGLAARLEGLRQALDGEGLAWQRSVVEDPLGDRWYKDGARPTIRGQWQAAVQGGLVAGLQTLAAWYQTPGGAKTPADRKQAIERLTGEGPIGLLWQAMAGSLQRGPNLLPNPGFDEGTVGEPGPAGPQWQTSGAVAGWSTWQEDPAAGAFFRDPETKRSGASSGAFKGGGCLCYITRIPIEAGKTYLAEVWAMAPAHRAETRVTLEVRWNDTQGRWYTAAPDLRVEARDSGTWERLLLPFTAPAGAPQAVILLVGYGIAAEDTVRYDDGYAGPVQRMPSGR
jgi:hypothetical protein